MWEVAWRDKISWAKSTGDLSGDGPNGGECMKGFYGQRFIPRLTCAKHGKKSGSANRWDVKIQKLTTAPDHVIAQLRGTTLTHPFNKRQFGEFQSHTITEKHAGNPLNVG